MKRWPVCAMMPAQPSCDVNYRGPTIRVCAQLAGNAPRGVFTRTTNLERVTCKSCKQVLRRKPQLHAFLLRWRQPELPFATAAAAESAPPAPPPQ